MSEFSGLLKSRIEIWKRAAERLASGVSSDSWERVGQFRAHIQAEGAGKQVEGMSLAALARFRVTMRFDAKVTIDQRIHWLDRRLLILRIIQDPATPDRMMLRCEELRS